MAPTYCSFGGRNVARIIVELFAQFAAADLEERIVGLENLLTCSTNLHREVKSYTEIPQTLHNFNSDPPCSRCADVIVGLIFVQSDGIASYYVHYGCIRRSFPYCEIKNAKWFALNGFQRACKRQHLSRLMDGWQWSLSCRFRISVPAPFGYNSASHSLGVALLSCPKECPAVLS